MPLPPPSTNYCADSPVSLGGGEGTGAARPFHPASKHNRVQSIDLARRLAPPPAPRELSAAIMQQRWGRTHGDPAARPRSRSIARPRSSSRSTLNNQDRGRAGEQFPPVPARRLTAGTPMLLQRHELTGQPRVLALPLSTCLQLTGAGLQVLNHVVPQSQSY
ncbi:hypothetical protein FRC08_004775 [Ceratobasidium sp. 394]|nr:hypothetical protein FRC08_004775 [Ceratobasidium sp. 394]